MQIFPQNHYFSPNFIFQRFQRILEKCGTENTLKNIQFQKEREAWITALYLMGLSKNTNKEYWIGIEEKENTPDTYGVSIRELNKGNSLDILNIEVCEWENHSKLSLSEHIKNKLKYKVYPKYFLLLCYVHHHTGEKIDLEAEFQKTIIDHYNIGEIQIIGSQLNSQYDHLIVQLYPHRQKFEFNRQDEVNRLINQIDIIRTEKGIGKSFYPLGLKKIPLPKCK